MGIQQIKATNKFLELEILYYNETISIDVFDNSYGTEGVLII